MGKANKTSFKKGEVTNPNGRPKGSLSPLRRQLVELRKMAANDIEAAYATLWYDFNNGDSAEKQLAKQIYFKELVSMPKEWLSEVNTEGMPREVRNAEDVNCCTLKLIEKLLNMDNISTQEALDLLRILKNNSLPEEESNTVKTLSREELIEKINLTKELIDLKKKNGEKD